MTDIDQIADEAAANFPWGDDITLRDPLSAYKACARHAALAALASAQSDMRELVEATLPFIGMFDVDGDDLLWGGMNGAKADDLRRARAALAEMEARTDD